MIRKLIIGGGIALVLLFVFILVGVTLFLDKAIKKGVETAGPMVAKVEMKVDSVSLSLFSGSGEVKGLVVGNPEGFKTPSAIRVGHASLSLVPRSLFSDKIVVKSVKIDAPEITFETDLKANNLGRIKANVEATTGGGSNAPSPAPGAPPAASGASRKLQVNEVLISNGKVNVSLTALAGQSIAVALPEIRLRDLGQGPEGITTAELTGLVLSAIEKAAAEVAPGAIDDLKKNAAKALGGALEKVTKGFFGDSPKKKN